MRFALFVLSLILVVVLSPDKACSVEVFSGYIIQSGNQRILKTPTHNVIITSEANDVKAQLFKLKSNDFISGLGNAIGGNVVRLQTIDFVGLNSFLGLWASPMGLFQVQDFSSLSLYTKGKPQSNSSNAHSSLNYSITPGHGASWVLFLTDADQIYFSNLTVTESKASIRFFDTKTGAFQQEIALSKISR